MSQQSSNQYAYNQELYEQHIKQLDKIKNQIEAQDQFIITQPIEPQILESEYLENQGFLKKVNKISQSYPFFRRMRRDGSCFYRAVLFRIFEYIFNQKISKYQLNLADLTAVGYELIVIDDFYDDIMKQIKLCPNNINKQGIVDAFCNKVTSDYLIMCMKMMTSFYIKANSFIQEVTQKQEQLQYFVNKKLIQLIRKQIKFKSYHCITTYKFQLGCSIWMGILPSSMPLFFKFQKMQIQILYLLIDYKDLDIMTFFIQNDVIYYHFHFYNKIIILIFHLIFLCWLLQYNVLRDQFIFFEQRNLFYFLVII
ncbi:unnamed protein product [Paramecium pentaurelia]|uniref:Uncharacterized protein n=1 Tax=Paramecium pentaurelia TaxID=43138 RepID=A0A8S1X6J6_9CILI|nr:unnamed protein product [Paramecium pentaurelia]